MKMPLLTKTALIVIASLFFACIATSCEKPEVIEIIEVIEEEEEKVQLLDVEILERTIKSKNSAGEDLLLSPTGAPIDFIGTFVNTGTTDALLSIQHDSTLRMIIPAGQMQIVEIANLRNMKVMPLGGEECIVDAKMYFAPAQNLPGGKFDLKAWNTEACGGGTGEYHPKNTDDCLFEQVTVWSSATPRQVTMDVYVLGMTDLHMELEFEDHTFSTFKAYAPPATLVHQSVIGEFDKVIAVRFRGEKNPVNGCAPLIIEGQLCFQ